MSWTPLQEWKQVKWALHVLEVIMLEGDQTSAVWTGWMSLTMLGWQHEGFLTVLRCQCKDTHISDAQVKELCAGEMQLNIWAQALEQDWLCL